MFRILLLIFVLVLLAVPTAGWWAAQRNVPSLDRVDTVTSLSSPSTVRFDERGIPYIDAATEKDAYFVQGYVTAVQRMFQMDIQRRTALGQLSEVFGAGSLAQDKLMRTIGFDRLAASDFKRLSPESRKNLDSYCRGVNSYLDRYEGKCGLPFMLLFYNPRHWEPTDTLALMRLWQYEIDESWRLDDLRQRILDKIGDKEASKLFNQNLKQDIVSEALGGEKGGETGAAKSGAAAPLAGFAEVKNLMAGCARLPAAASLAASPLTGSNAWVVSSGLSDSKGAMLACDKHSLFSLPDKWYLCSINTPKLHIAGATIPGVPGVLIGRNDEVAWGSAALRADTQDLYLEQFSPQFPGKYKTPSGWQNAEEVSEDINVRFSTPVVHKILLTRHGPVLVKNEATAVALCWTAHKSTGEPPLDTMQKLTQAGSWQDFTKAISHYCGPPETFVYADRHGNIGYHAAGEVPVRGVDQGNIIEPGWTGAFDWRRNATFGELPGQYNPQDGFALAGDPRYFGSYSFSSPYRAMRISSVLSSYKKSGEHAGLPDMAVLQGDQFGFLSASVKSELKEAANKVELIDRFQSTALGLLDRWDGMVKPDSPAAAIYESFIMTTARRVLEPKLGAKLTTEYMQRWPRWSCLVELVLKDKPKEWLPPEERTYETFLLTTFANSLTSIRKALKSDDPGRWSWQNLHKATFHARVFDENSPVQPLLSFVFDKGPVGLGGDQDTVNSVNIDASVDPLNFSSSIGPTVRLIIDMSDRDKFYETLTLGEDEHLLSPYRTDQLRAWLKIEPHAMAFSSDQLDRQQQHKLVLSNE